MTEPFQPLSVRTGKREPLTFVEGIPEHFHGAAIEWVASELRDSGDDNKIIRTVAQLRIPPIRSDRDVPALQDYERVTAYCEKDDEAFLDVIDYLLNDRIVWIDVAWREDRLSGTVREINDILTWGASCWKVGVKDANIDFDEGPAVRHELMRRVQEVTEKAYLQALDIEGNAPDYLMTAWHAAYGRKEDPATVWASSLSAVEAAVQPIVAPKNPQASLGMLRQMILGAEDKWNCDLPVWGDKDTTPVRAFVQCLSRVTNNDGRHGGDGRAPDMTQARAVLAQAITICEWMRAEVFREK